MQDGNLCHTRRTGSVANRMNLAENWLIWLFVSRAAVSVSFMMYAGTLTAVTTSWNMSAAEAGFVQTASNVSYAVSLVLAGWLSDRLGARRVFFWSSICIAVIGVLVAFFARSYESGVFLFAFFGMFHGGTYAPSIMLVAQGVPPERRGFAIGLVLAGASLGYAGSIAITTAVSTLVSYQAAFMICGWFPTLAAVAAWFGTRGRPNLVIRRELGATSVFGVTHRRFSSILTLGYTAHCWELLGMWAWMPAFLVASLAANSATDVVTQGVWIGVAIHISGCLSAFTMGHASDRFGRRAVLIALATFGALCSLSIGWLGQTPSVLILALAALYGFAALGDSPVLSTAITEAVAPSALGSALAIRSILGFGAGGLAPLAFGAIRDFAPAGFGWAAAFSCLGVGGILAALFAVLLPTLPVGRSPSLATTNTRTES